MNEPGSPEHSVWNEESAILDREAGFGWHPDGRNDQVYEAIKKREELLDTVVNTQHDIHEEEKENLWNAYYQQIEKVIRLKEQFEVGDPPMQIPSPEE
ncbi:hypothetical protein H0X10_00885 [Candidatus Saccharibacteria bacterium]|nr:hypothetical protein [Candidatus Saccharibacteria bacterium]